MSFGPSLPAKGVLNDLFPEGPACSATQEPILTIPAVHIEFAKNVDTSGAKAISAKDDIFPRLRG